MLLFIPDCDHVTTMLPVHDMSCVACMNSCARQFDCVCFVLCTHVTAARAFSNNFEAFKDHGILTEHGIELCAVMLSCRPACAHHPVSGQRGPIHQVRQCAQQRPLVRGRKLITWIDSASK